MALDSTFDLIVLGAGSGGLAAAKRAASFGAKVVVVEGDQVGGTCVIRGCVPKKLLVYGSSYGEYIGNAPEFGVLINDFTICSKTLLKNVRKEVQRLNSLHEKFLENAGITLVHGWAEFLDSNSVLVKDSNNTRILNGKNILIAVGGVPKIPNIPGASLGWISDDMFLLNDFPEHIFIVGGGYIACEFACILNGLGIQVDLFVRGDKILREFDRDLSKNLEDNMKLNGINIHFKTDILGLESRNSKLVVFTSTQRDISCSGLLWAIGRAPRIDSLNLQAAGIDVSQGCIITNEFQSTNIPNIFAVGDVTNRVNLTPVAIDEGRAFADRIFGSKSRTVNYDLVSKAVFSNPEIATVGLSEEQASRIHGKKQLRIYKSTFRPMSQALPKRGAPCMLKLVVHTKTDKILGCHMVGEHSSEIIQMAAVSIGMGARKSDFDQAMALHPTIAEEFVTMT